MSIPIKVCKISNMVMVGSFSYGLEGISLYFRKRLLTRTLPVNNSLLTGTVLVNNSLLTRTTLVNNSLLTATTKNPIERICSGKYILIDRNCAVDNFILTTILLVGIPLSMGLFDIDKCSRNKCSLHLLWMVLETYLQSLVKTQTS